MDLATIKSAYDGLKIAKDVFSSYNELKNEADALGKVNEAVKKVGEAQDALYELREQMFRLQEENNNLKQKLSENANWEEKISNYQLVATVGGAIVYQSKEGTHHFICPSCVTRRQIHPLQDRRVASGTYDCTGCGASFPVKPSEYPKGSFKVTLA